MTLERNSIRQDPCCAGRPADAGRIVYECGELLQRHMHFNGFFAVVLKGWYIEAGDTGRHRAAAGDVIVHRAYEWHLDRISANGAEALVLPFTGSWLGSPLAQTADPDIVARLAERDIVEARQVLVDAMIEKSPTIEDWPDLLAQDLLADPDRSLAVWADEHRLHPGSLARGFGQQFGITPSGYRTFVRARRAIDSLASTQSPLSTIAFEQGFADQAHLTRTVKRVTGYPPQALRQHLRLTP